MEMKYHIRTVQIGGMGQKRALEILRAAGLTASAATSCFPNYTAVVVKGGREAHLKAHKLVYRG